MRNICTSFCSASGVGDDLGQNFVQRGLHLFAAGGPVAFFRMPQRRHSGRFLDNHDVQIDVADLDVIIFGRSRLGMLHDADDIFGLQSPPFIQAEIPVDLNESPRQQFADLCPRFPRQPLSQ